MNKYEFDKLIFGGYMLNANKIDKCKSNKKYILYTIISLIIVFLSLDFLSPNINCSTTNCSAINCSAINCSTTYYGAESNPSGDPIGGGEGYSNIISKSQAKYNVTNNTELINALNNSKSGDIIYIEDNATIDLSGQQDIPVPGGITIASGRGFNGSKGALLYTNSIEYIHGKVCPVCGKPYDGVTFPILFDTQGEGIRFTGFRLRGPDMEQNKSNHGYSVADGIRSSYSFLEVDNCELYGWSHAAIFLDDGSTEAKIHHNYIHHCQRQGYGYGISHGYGNATSIIECNIFDYCRHCIAATGTHGNSYEARYNIVMDHEGGRDSHSFDVHGGSDRQDGTNIAGDSFVIDHNTFKATRVPGIVVRGRPTIGVQISNNWFYHGDQGDAIRQINSLGNIFILDNLYGQTDSNIINSSAKN